MTTRRRFDNLEGMSKLPLALARRAERASKLKLARVIAAARADIAFIRRKKSEIADAFYDIGEALVRLRAKGVPSALGRRSFAELCEKDLGISPAWADTLIGVVGRMPREAARELGATKAGALVELVDATPQNDSPSGALARGIAMPSGERLDVKHASARALNRAAKEVRAANPRKSARGRHVATEDAEWGAGLQRALRAAGAKSAEVTILAGLPGKPARVRIEGVTIAEASVLGRVLARRARGG